MPIVDTCWSPFIWASNLKTGCKVIAVYTIALSIVLITLMIHQLCGGESTQMYSPLFEKTWNSDIFSNSQLWYSLFYILYLLGLAISSILMIYGMHRNIRGFMIPWLALWGLIIFYQFLYGFWLIYAYYIYLQQVFAAIINWIWMCYNMYCWLCVLSMYKIIEKWQTPNIELLF